MSLNNRPFAPSASFRLAMCDAAVVAASFFVLVQWTMLIDPWIFFIEENGALRLAPVIVLLLLAMYFSGLYEQQPVTSRILLLQQLCFGIGVCLFSQAMISYVKQDWILPRSLALYGCLLSLFTLFAWRLLRDAVLNYRRRTPAILLLGTDPAVHRIARYIAQSPGLRLKVAGSLTNDPANAVGPVLGTPADLRRVVGEIQPEMVVTGFADPRDQTPTSDMLDIRFSGTRIEEASTACELLCRHVLADQVRPSRTLFTSDFDPKSTPLLVGLADKLSAGALFVFGSPAALLCAMVFRLHTGKSVFVRESCAGFQGKVFQSRRMAIPARGFFAAIARYLQLDEWPQTWNVLAGHMSMVGPRPDRVPIAAELSRICPIYEYRQNARPGITGWARINLAPAADAPPATVIDTLAEVEYDLYFISHQTPSLYAYILLHGLRSST
jgi:lipopolysaccharide/colanic/teichoic acid biosynthesis glycosyltransferase